MAYLRCTGGGSGPEVIEGTIYGTTNARAEFTVTSQQGKAPKRAMIWMSELDTGKTGGCQMFWNSDFVPERFCGFSSTNINVSSTSPSPFAPLVGTTSNYIPQVKSVGADSITIKLNGTNTYIQGTLKYRVEFE